jgi:hypothetical protein
VEWTDEILHRPRPARRTMPPFLYVCRFSGVGLPGIWRSDAVSFPHLLR